MVKLTKATLSKALPDKDHSDLDLSHALQLVKYVLNSRPLTPVSDNKEDPVAITPNMFVRDLGNVCNVSSPLDDGIMRKLARAAH